MELERELRMIRPQLAKYLLALLALTIILHALLLASFRYTGLSPSDIDSVFNTTFTGLMTLAGSAIGFYFGNVRSSRTGGKDSAGEQ